MANAKKITFKDGTPINVSYADELTDLTSIRNLVKELVLQFSNKGPVPYYESVPAITGDNTIDPMLVETPNGLHYLSSK